MLLSCVPGGGEDCAPLLLGGYTALASPPTVGDVGVEPFSSTSGSGGSTVTILIVAIVVVVLLLLLVIFLASRARKRADALAREDENTRRRHQDEDDALDDELAAAGTEEEDQEIVVLREKRPYVVGYGRPEREVLPVSDDTPDRGGRTGRVPRDTPDQWTREALPVY
jgi:hypothetical protein